MLVHAVVGLLHPEVWFRKALWVEWLELSYSLFLECIASLEFLFSWQCFFDFLKRDKVLKCDFDEYIKLRDTHFFKRDFRKSDAPFSSRVGVRKHGNSMLERKLFAFHTFDFYSENEGL